jgi:hypothetical protein
MRLHLRAPHAQQQPKGPQRKPCDSLGAEARQQTERGYRGKRHHHQAGAQQQDFGYANSGGKQPGGMEEG